MYQTAAYDKPNDDGFPADPVAIIVATGTHDVSRLAGLFRSGNPTVEQCKMGEQLTRQLARRNRGRAALRLLAEHGGPDLLAGQDTAEYQPAAERDGNALYVHGCGNVEWWGEQVGGPINDQGCDACESAPDGTWQPLYVKRDRT